MFQILTDLILAHQRGEDAPAPHRPVPPAHLSEQTWKFVCGCGLTYRHVADAVWRDNDWRPPQRQCLQCQAWPRGYRVEP